MSITFLLVAATACVIVFWLHAPIAGGPWTKQTLYLWLLDGFHVQAEGATQQFLLIDDDSGEGVYELKRICEETGMKATFAVIPNRMEPHICDSLRTWQQQGYGIALHGFNHDSWQAWTSEEIVEDISRSERWLQEKGFQLSTVRYVVPPYGCYTQNIRIAIEQKGYQMVTGANIVNPDTAVFQLGRLFITKATDTASMKSLLQRAIQRNAFVVFGTHSSNKTEFSEEKIREVLQLIPKQ